MSNKSIINYPIKTILSIVRQLTPNISGNDVFRNTGRSGSLIVLHDIYEIT